MVYPRECTMCPGNEYIFCCFGGEMLCKYQLNPSVVACTLRSLFPCWFFVLEDLPIDVNGVLKSPAIAILLSVSPICSSRISLHISMLLYWVRMFTRVICSLLDRPFFVSHYGLCFDVCFVSYRCYCPSLHFHLHLRGVSFPPLHFQSVCIFCLL